MSGLLLEDCAEELELLEQLEHELLELLLELDLDLEDDRELELDFDLDLLELSLIGEDWGSTIV